MSHCTRHYEELDGVTVMVINPCCEMHAPHQPYISRATISAK
ncbi:MAG TPA: hypothetical protein VMV57_02210 [Terracidiphilus sp.]|nr:hypothetical protein [Terracidiphilus sp.]